MDTGKLITTLQNLDKAVQPEIEKLATRIANNKLKIDFSQSLPTTAKDIEALSGKKLIRVDVPAKNRSTGMSYLAETELDETLTKFLDGKGGAKDVPPSMQMVLDISEASVELVNKYLKTTLKKDLVFENPSLTLWELPSDFNYESTIFSRFTISIGDEKKFEVVRIFPTFLLSELLKEEKVQTENQGIFTDSFEAGNGGGKVLPLEDLYDLQLEISAELGRTNMTLQKLLDIGKGGIIELNKFAGDPVELFVNDKKFAEGEVVVVDQNFAVRITKLLSDKERLKSISNAS